MRTQLLHSEFGRCGWECSTIWTENPIYMQLFHVGWKFFIQQYRLPAEWSLIRHIFATGRSAMVLHYNNGVQSLWCLQSASKVGLTKCKSKEKKFQLYTLPWKISFADWFITYACSKYGLLLVSNLINSTCSYRLQAHWEGGADGALHRGPKCSLEPKDALLN